MSFCSRGTFLTRCVFATPLPAGRLLEATFSLDHPDTVAKTVHSPLKWTVRALIWPLFAPAKSAKRFWHVAFFLNQPGTVAKPARSPLKWTMRDFGEFLLLRNVSGVLRFRNAGFCGAALEGHGFTGSPRHGDENGSQST